MRASTFLTAISLGQATLAAIEPKNFIFIVPDGMGPVSQTLLRTYLSMVNGNSSARAPRINALPIDVTVIGNTRTHSANNLVTDSGAAGTALATGYKTDNGAIGVMPDGTPVGSVMEAAKLAGYLTGLVVTSPISHATPAAYFSHALSRNALDKLAEQQIGYSHPLGISVDLMLGGGRCYFQPQNESDSCRTDDIDLFAYAESKGYYTARDRASFDALELGLGDIKLPYVGLFKDGDLSYEVDRQQQAAEVREPSLSEMTQAALNSLSRASASNEKGYIMMIEASRIDHSSHAHDSVAHLHEVFEFNNVVNLVMKWIDSHPDTAFLAVADHETGGITIPSQYDPSLLQPGTHSVEYLSELWSDYNGTDRAAYLSSKIIPSYGLTDVSDAEVEKLLGAGDGFGQELADLLNARAGLEWSTGGHTGVDTTLYGYAAGGMGDRLVLDMAGGWDNTDLPKYVAAALGVDMGKVTELLNANGTEWVPRDDGESERKR
ncbi:repressible alkaline phosphatase [Alternaria rosae]|uniref:repressible alkaline phosphatase n=1 Tax=Alternaria rosae TaxID=1187941 RepID=UPI001E8D0925|nr:repressible alkaline phosphatase [Alternaria rosae]KAH6882293.1 repressible alkaline phosphatase [Alternaria rosae]